MADGRSIAPASGRRIGRSHPKGRQVDPAALDEVQALLGARPRRRDLLIEFLHLIQDRYGHLAARHLAALAEEMRLPQAEVYEVATFYAHFDVVLEHEPAPPAITVRVCESLSCAMAGSAELMAKLQRDFGPEVRVIPAPCMGRCDAAPAVSVGHRAIAPATAKAVDEAVQAKQVDPVVVDYPGLDAYRAAGGYATLAACLAGEKTRDEIIAGLSDASLRGLGGAGFPTGRKWSLVRAEPKPRLMAVNADEGEVGTFKDRHVLATAPHRFLEGALIAGWVIEADEVFIYLRDEYPELRAILLAEIAAVERAGLAPHTKLHLRRGAGAYICGEESAMLESIEGKRGYPRHRPPYVAQVGLFGRPTLVNNVETLYWVPEILRRGAAWFADQGRRGAKGVRHFSVSGRVRNPGVKLAPAGITLRELVDEFCGGMAPGHTLKAYLPGGASGGILPERLADLPLDFGTLREHGAFVGSHAVVVLSDKDDLKAAALNLMRFFEHESCGQCTPCRVGTEKSVKLMARPQWDKPLLDELGKAMTDASICGLGQAAANPVFSLLRFFPDEAAR
ncbi:MAG: NAD(P)H-dependent oxidoreductase subunit E [Rhodospirillaceae bacterium]|nr:NAD(P)H-dependent oxidoreductase subunit E [Rhodospirillaceae bacterium]